MKFVGTVGELEYMITFNKWIYKTQFNINGNFIYFKSLNMIRSYLYASDNIYHSLFMDEELEIYSLGEI